MLFFVCTE